MGVNHADVLAVVLRFDKAFHHFFALTAGKVAGLGTDNFDIRGFRNGFGEAFLTVNRHAGAYGPLQLNNVTRFAIDGFHQPLADQLAFQHVVGGHGGHVEVFIFNINGAVEQEYRDFGLFRFFQYRFPAGRHHRSDEDGIDALSDERADGFNLVFLFLLRIGNLQSDTALRGFLLRDVGFCRTPARFRADL